MLSLLVIVILLGSIDLAYSANECAPKALWETSGKLPLPYINLSTKVMPHQFLFSNGSNTAVIKYYISEATKTPRQGTILFLCGGPGSPCPRRLFNSGLEGYDTITVDYLGIGDNRMLSKPQQMSADSQGQMVATLIDHLERKDILLVGHSYGTAIATVAASKYTHLEMQKSKLRGVFITGVVGPSKSAVYGPEFLANAQGAWAALSTSEQKNFIEIYDQISIKMNPKQRRDLDNHLTEWITGGVNKTTEILRSFMKYPKLHVKESVTGKTTTPESIESLWQIRASGCELLEKISDFKRQKVFGDKVRLRIPVSPETCSCRLLPANWDPNKYQIKDIPVIYLNGGEDPNTPLAGAVKHFDGQKQVSRKVLLVDQSGGHSIFMEKKLGNCLTRFLSHLTTNDLNSIEIEKDNLIEKGCPTPLPPGDATTVGPALKQAEQVK